MADGVVGFYRTHTHDTPSPRVLVCVSLLFALFFPSIVCPLCVMNCMRHFTVDSRQPTIGQRQLQALPTPRALALVVEARCGCGFAHHRVQAFHSRRALGQFCTTIYQVLKADRLHHAITF
jgi:hypothetical protein